jgi:hypothetical protein
LINGNGLGLRLGSRWIAFGGGGGRAEIAFILVLRNMLAKYYDKDAITKDVKGL